MRDKLVNQYHFQASWGGTRIDFLEISGLDLSIEVISVKGSNSPDEVEMKIPGLLKFSEVTLKRTICKGDSEFFDWINTKAFGKVERRNITISLLDETHSPVFVWKLKNCFPSKYIGPVLLSDDSDVAVESIAIVHEGISIESSK